MMMMIDWIANADSSERESEPELLSEWVGHHGRMVQMA